MGKSRYADTDVVDDRFFASWRLPAQARGLRGNELLAGVKTADYVTRAGDRLDHLAAKFYNEDSYWWVLALVNGIAWPLGIPIGTTLRVPLDHRAVFDKIFRG